MHCLLLLLQGFLQKFPQKSDILQLLIDYKFCDYNFAIYLELVNIYRINYDLDDYQPSSSLCLSKRPIAQTLLFQRDALKTEMSVWVKDREIRREIYRLIYKNGWNICWAHLRAFIISCAIPDLEDESIEESDVRRILMILANAEDFVNDDMKLKLARILEKKKYLWTLDSTKCAMKQVESIICDKPVDSAWIRNSFNLEDVEAKEIALNTGCRFVSDLKPNATFSDNFYKDHELKLISAVAMYLQDDDSDIREKASSYLCHLFSYSSPLNPAVCRLLISNWILRNGDSDYSDDEDENLEEEEDLDAFADDSLFDACSFNQYAEREVFGNVQLYYSIRERIGEPSDVFELEMDFD
ncbi:unnamed protein product [Caenorhabditis angaria]|uniref:PID domain-containing protein n=1 Tax=Caenorhabditis angaria TaxID=860376 RepID=A0A9P1IBL7_9PELO|nr:unnamed protein product [Caenorhabditis angaria]